MSEKKFNLKNYVKINGDVPIGSRLMDEHGDVPDEVTEKQLDKDRVPEENVTIEKLLEKTRLGGADMLPEGRLNTETSMFGKYRDSSAYDGDMNKVEEQRLAGSPVEKEKYTDSSETPKKLRWWEDGGKSPDGLKLANNKKPIKVAQALQDEDFFEEEEESPEELSFDNSWERVPEVWNEEGEGVLPEKTNPLLGNVDEFDVVDNGDASLGSMKIKESHDLSGPIKGVRMVLTYDPDAFDGDVDAIKEAALSAVISQKPQLDGLISLDDFYDINESGEEATVVLKAFGDEFGAVDTSEDSNPLFSEMGFSQDDSSGTMISSGAIKVSDKADQETVVRDALDFINDLHPRLNVTEDSLDLSKMKTGIIGFLVSPRPMGGDVEADVEVDTGEDFAIDEVAPEVAPEVEPEGVFAQSKSPIKTNVKKN